MKPLNGPALAAKERAYREHRKRAWATLSFFAAMIVVSFFVGRYVGGMPDTKTTAEKPRASEIVLVFTHGGGYHLAFMDENGRFVSSENGLPFGNVMYWKSVEKP